MTLRGYVHNAAGRESRVYRCSVKFITITTTIIITVDIQKKKWIFTLLHFLPLSKEYFLQDLVGIAFLF